MRVLVDTSVWIGHFKQRNEHLVTLLEAGLVVSHPHVLVEVACGTPPNRRAILDLLVELDHSPVATHEELLGLIERRALHGRGVGFVDMSLLASALLDSTNRPGCGRWTSGSTPLPPSWAVPTCSGLQ